MSVLFFFWGLFLSHSGVTNSAFAADAEVQATVDRNQVGVGDVINLSVSVRSSQSVQVEPPSLKGLTGFDLVNTSSGSETRSSYENGRFVTEQSRIFNYMLAVSQKGQLTIPSIEVIVNGQAFRTQPISISANSSRPTPPPPQAQMDPQDEMEELFNQMLQRRLAPGFPGGRNFGQPGQEPAINPNEAFFIQAETDKTKAFVGEQITASFYLYTRGQIRDIDTLKYPDLKGFWKEELEMATRLNFEQVVVGGIAYQRALLVSYALFPIKAGKVTVESYKAKCTVLTPTNFGFGRPYVFTKASRPIGIEVSDIPTDGRPSNFSGAVGRFRVTANFEPPTGVVNQPVNLRVRFEGMGNAKLIELPNLNLPPSFEIYDQKSQAKFMKDGMSYKEFDVMIIPREPGVFNLNAVSASVFEPETKKFMEAKSQALQLTVTGSAQTGQNTPASADKTAPLKKEDPGPTLPSVVLQHKDGGRAFPLWPVTVALGISALGFLGLISYRRWAGRPQKVKLSQQLNQRLKSIRAAINKDDWRKVGVELTNTIYFVLGKVSQTGGANRDVESLLENTPPSLRNELADSIRKELQKTELLAFGPESVLTEMKTKAALQNLTDQVEKVLARTIEMSLV